MPNTSVSRASRRALDFAGQTVDLTNYTSTSANRVQTWTETAASPHTITARVDQRNSPRPSRDVRESGDVDVDASIHIADDSSGNANIRPGGGPGASTIDVDRDGTDDYRVLTRHDNDAGLLKLECEAI